MTLYNTIQLRIKLLFLREKELYSAFSGILGFCPRDLRLYKEAVMHSSSAVRNAKGERVNNERLEFLGDAVLNAVVADVLFRKYGKGREGFLTTMRSRIVKRESLNRIADKLGLVSLLRISQVIHTHNCNLAGNALEALIGAVYLDRGYDVCRKFITERLLTEFIDFGELAKSEENYKSKIIEWAQKKQVDFEFVVVEQTFDEYKNPIFTSVLRIDGKEMGKGGGYSKKESHQEAAKDAYFRFLEPASEKIEEN